MTLHRRIELSTLSNEIVDLVDELNGVLALGAEYGLDIELRLGGSPSPARAPKPIVAKVSRGSAAARLHLTPADEDRARNLSRVVSPGPRT